jgi:hypothetical protein
MPTTAGTLAAQQYLNAFIITQIKTKAIILGKQTLRMG